MKFGMTETARALEAAFPLILLCGMPLGAAEFLMEPARGFEPEGAQVSLSKGKEGVLASQVPLPPGRYQFEAECRTEGMEAAGKFASDAMAPDWKTKLSSYEWSHASPDWAPLSFTLLAKSQSPVIVRFGNWQGAAEGAKLFLRGAKLRSLELESGKSWLVNGDWELGSEGSLPPFWEWKGTGDPAAQCGLAKNSSFKTGRHVLRMAAKAGGKPIISSHCMPLPKEGEIEFSVWARSEAPGGKFVMHIVCEGWSVRAEAGCQAESAWKEFSVRLPVPPDLKKDFFFVRLDSHAEGALEFAGAKAVWHSGGKKGGDGVDEAWRGWQGVPGRNLIYNPDFELGGAGYFYDYSWPKSYKNYLSTLASQRTLLLEGKGVDGGTCAWIRGAALRSYCFPVTVGKTYTFSVDLRAPEGQEKAEAMALAFDTEWQCALWQSASGIPGDKWKRYSWTVKWDKPNVQRRGYFRIDSSGGVLVDRVQVAEGGLKDYEAPPVMLGLVCDRWPYFVRGRDKASMRLKVVPGEIREGRASVKIVAKDAWKREAWRRQLEAPLDAPSSIPIDLPEDKLGSFHVELAAEIDGKAAGMGISRYAIMDKPVLQEASLGSPSLFGVCQESFNYPVWLCEDHAKIHLDLGVRLNRFFASVPPDLPDPIPQEFVAELLAKCRPFREAGVDLMPCVELIPKPVADACAHTLKTPSQEDLDGYGKALEAYVRALKPEISYWEIFNEPNLWRVASGPDKGKPTMFPKKYFEFQKVAWKTIKGVDPKMQVACNALNTLPQEWIEEWMKLGAGDYMDIFSFHPYASTDICLDAQRLRKTLDSYGFKKPVLNSERYFGCNLFYDRAGYEETRRSYYLPHGQELQTAARSMVHFISHAACRIPCCAFNPPGTLFTLGPANATLLYDFFPAYNAATRFLVDSGSGEKLDFGASPLSGILFPDAKGGPLLALWTPLEKAEGRILLEGEWQACDIMGNPYSQEELKDGLRVACDPVYVRCKPGVAPAAIKASLAKADIVGLGDPFKLDLTVLGPERLSAAVTNWRNKPVSGTVKLLSAPEGWSAKRTQAEFNGLAAGKTARLDFDFESMRIESMGEYPVSLMAESGQDFVRRDAVLKPLFAKRASKIVPDGDLSEWKDAAWISLGDANLSKAFNPSVKPDGRLAARLACAWGDGFFAIAAEVDEANYKAAEAERMGWEGSSLQLYFDPKNDNKLAGGSRADDVSYTVFPLNGATLAWLDKGAEGNYKGAANKAEGFNDVDVQAAVRRADGKTVYEILLPKSRCLPGATLEKGSCLGFSLLINHNGGSGRGVGLTLAPKGQEPYGNPSDYRDAVLIE